VSGPVPRHAALFSPAPWARLSPALRTRFTAADERLRSVLREPQPDYRRLSALDFAQPCPLILRPAVRDLVAARGGQRCSMLAETRRFLALRDTPLDETVPLFDLVHRLHARALDRTETPRHFDVAVVYALELPIRPPALCDAIFAPLDSLSGPPLYRAICAFLTVVSAHPFSDGNGRVARLLFNLYLAQHCGGRHFVPLAELTHQTCGIYEELFARAAADGPYDDVLQLVLQLVERYAEAVMAQPAGGRLSELQQVRHQAARAGSVAAGTRCINDSPPYPLSLAALAAAAPSQVNLGLVGRMCALAHGVGGYGDIRFAITRLDYFDPGWCGTPSIALFIDTNRKEALLADARELRSRFCNMNIQFVPGTQDPITEARLLINIAARYESAAHAQARAVLLYDLAAAASVGKSGRNNNLDILENYASH
jgi:hypothetical protein